MEKLHEENKSVRNHVMVTIKGIKEPSISEDLVSIKEIGKEKIEEFEKYCISKGVYYFSELPISESINDIIITAIETGVDTKSLILDAEKIKNRTFWIPIITPLSIYKNAMKKLRVYNSIIEIISNMDFEDIYKAEYAKYYINAIVSKDVSEIEEMLKKDEELAVRLDMVEQFQEIKSIAERFIEKKKKDCKINVYKKD